MNNFISSNKKYLIILAIGLILFLVPNISDYSDKNQGNSSELKFKEVVESAKGIGKIKIMTNITKDGVVKGVVIVAEGAEQLEIKKQITDAAVAAFDVLPHKVQIFSYKQEEVSE